MQCKFCGFSQIPVSRFGKCADKTIELFCAAAAQKRSRSTASSSYTLLADYIAAPSASAGGDTDSCQLLGDSFRLTSVLALC